MIISRRSAVLGVAAFFGLVVVASDQIARPFAPFDPADKAIGFSMPFPYDPIFPPDPPCEIRRLELSRRALPPVGDPKRESGLTYKEVSKGIGGPTRPRPAEAMPQTICSQVERVPVKRFTAGAPNAHRSAVHLFESQSGFGFWRMIVATNDRGVAVGSRDIDRVELVSLLMNEEPSVYVLAEMATPPLARQAKRRPLDEFERLGLNALRFGEELVWTREAPNRMFGAIRARTDCLHCHANAKKGDLLGAFTYYLKVPVERVRSPWVW